MYVFLDTETTKKDEGRLVQLAIKTDTGYSWNLLFKPAEEITIEAMAVHHITNEMVEGEPTVAESADMRKMVQDLLDGGIVVAHNALFDIGVLEREGFKVGHWMDTVRLSQHLTNLPCHQLQYLRYALKLDKECQGAVAHDAMGDVIVLEQLFKTLNAIAAVRVSEKKGSVATVEEIEDHMFALSQTPVLMKIMPFGKYVGQSFEHVAKIDRGYLQWLAVREGLSEDLAFTLNHFLKF